MIYIQPKGSTNRDLIISNMSVCNASLIDEFKHMRKGDQIIMVYNSQMDKDILKKWYDTIKKEYPEFTFDYEITGNGQPKCEVRITKGNGINSMSKFWVMWLLFRYPFETNRQETVKNTLALRELHPNEDFNKLFVAAHYMITRSMCSTRGLCNMPYLGYRSKEESLNYLKGRVVYFNTFFTNQDKHIPAEKINKMRLVDRSGYGITNDLKKCLEIYDSILV